LLNARTVAIYRRILNARAARLGVTLDEAEKGSGKPLCIIAAEQEAKRRGGGVTANDILDEDIKRLTDSIQCWQSDPKHPEEGYSPAIPLPFYARHWIFWTRPACYPCRKKFATLAGYEGHYIDNHMGQNENPSR
jgi:hypothetical protein